MPSASLRIASWARRLASGAKVRSVPCRHTRSAITFAALPPSTVPSVRTTAVSGSASRLTTACSATTTWAAAATASTPSCGRAPWPARPVTSIRTWSAAAAIAPGRVS